MVKVKCSEIVWDLDDSDDFGDTVVQSDLPNEIVLEFSEDVYYDNDASELLGDKLSELIGYCHHGFRYEVL